MIAHPGMVAGPGHLDTHLMQVVQGRIIANGGAEGIQGLELRAGALDTKLERHRCW